MEALTLRENAMFKIVLISTALVLSAYAPHALLFKLKRPD